MSRVTGLSHQPRATAAAAAATADDPGGARLPRAPLPDEHGQVVSPVDAHELDVRPVGETAVRLERGPSRRRSSRVGSSSRTTACGLPTDAVVSSPPVDDFRLADGHRADGHVGVERVRAPARATAVPRS